MIVERFSEGSSLLHSIDPRVKICLAFPLAFAVALSDRFLVIGMCLLAAVFLMFFAKLKLMDVARSLRVPTVFIVMIWIFLPISMPGNTVYTLGRISLSSEGILRALSITLKCTTILLFIITLLSTSTVFTLVHAMHHLRMPKKLLYLTFLSYRYIHVLHGEYIKMRNAMKIRGFKPKTNIHTYRTFAYLAGMLLIRSYDRSERIYRAMICRGFHGEFYLFDHFEIDIKDIIFLSFMIILLTGIIWLEWITKIV